MNTKHRFNIDKTSGAWDGDIVNKHYHDNNLCQSLINIFKQNNIKNVLDLGCGIGKYSKAFIDNNIVCNCYDGHPDTNLLTNNLCDTIDLSKPISLKKTYDCVLSLEVGEHIPQIYENNFINNIVNHSHNLIIISWAVPGQPGDGHVNCKTNDYIIDRIEKYNFYFNETMTQTLRGHSSLWWFKNTIMFFQKTKPY